MVGLKALRATASFYELRSVTQGKAETQPRGLRSVGRLQLENVRRKGLLSAERGNRRLYDRRDEKNKHEVRGNSAGRIIFTGVGHASSQGF